MCAHATPRSDAIDKVVEEIVEDVVHELNADQYDNRRKIETTERRNDLSHPAKQRIGQQIEYMHDLADKMVRGVENAKGDQPARDHGGYDDEGVKSKNRVDQPASYLDIKSTAILELASPATLKGTLRSTWLTDSLEDAEIVAASKGFL